AREDALPLGAPRHLAIEDGPALQAGHGAGLGEGAVFAGAASLLALEVSPTERPPGEHTEPRQGEQSQEPGQRRRRTTSAPQQDRGHGEQRHEDEHGKEREDDAPRGEELQAGSAEDQEHLSVDPLDMDRWSTLRQRPRPGSPGEETTNG